MDVELRHNVHEDTVRPQRFHQFCELFIKWESFFYCAQFLLVSSLSTLIPPGDEGLLTVTSPTALVNTGGGASLEGRGEIQAQSHVA